MFPVFLDNKTISFASDGQAGLGGLDVYYSMWMDDEHKWGTPINAGIPVNSSYDDMSLTMYEDGRNGFFASNRPAPKKGDNIYHYLKQRIYLDLKVIDAATEAPIEGAAVAIESIKNQQSFASDAGGGVIDNLFPQTRYDVKVSKVGYTAYSSAITTAEMNGRRDTMQLVVKLNPEAVSYKATILDEATKEPIDNALLVVTKEGSNQTDTFNLSRGEALNKMLDANSVYHINSVKDQYYSDEKIVSTRNLVGGISSLTDTILMCKLSVGAICQVENIYYDYNKAVIRADALPALNKLLKLLREYPTMAVQLNSHTTAGVQMSITLLFLQPGQTR
jgi:outer membrane protein OmpA-like peptidoglycan-associated protein